MVCEFFTDCPYESHRQPCQIPECEFYQPQPYTEERPCPSCGQPGPDRIADACGYCEFDGVTAAFREANQSARDGK